MTPDKHLLILKNKCSLLAKFSLCVSTTFYLAASTTVILLASISLFVFYQATLLVHQDLSQSQKLLFTAPTLFFYLGIVYWYLVTCFYTKKKRNAFLARTFIFIVSISLILYNNFNIALFSQLGDSTNLYIAYYFLTDFTRFQPSYLQFLIVAYLPFVLFLGITVLFSYHIKSDHNNRAKIHLGLVCLMIFASFFSFSPHIANSHSSNLLSYTLSSFNQSPNSKHFQHPATRVQQHQLNKPHSQPNIAIIILESTRKDALSFYNPNLKHKTPFFDELANDSLVFHRAQGIVPHTSKAIVSIQCGIPPYLNMPIIESLYGVPNHCLANELDKFGYENFFMQSATHYFENRDNLVKKLGFKQFFSAESVDSASHSKNYFGFVDDVILDENQQWLSNNQQPFFANYLTIGPHWPYEPDPNHQELTFFEPKYQGLRLFDLQKSFNHYLNAVHYQDKFLAQLIQQYKDAGIYENTVFIVLADHGESFGEHHHLQHNNNLYPETLDIPMLVHIPFAKEYHGENHDLIQQTDIFSIVNNILQQRAPLHDIDNQALFASCWYWRWCVARTDKTYRYIHNFDNAPDELYDIAKDSQMAQNIAPQHQELIKRFRQETLAWYNGQLALYWQFFSPHDKNFYRIGSPGGTNLGTFQSKTPLTE